MKLLYAFACLLVFAPIDVHAARLFLEPVAGEVSYGETLYIPVRLDVQGACVNAARVEIAYDPSVLSVQDITTAESIFSLWTITPHITREGTEETGLVVLEGGVPGGYCGRVEGDPGLTDVLAKMIVRILPRADASVPPEQTVLPILSGSQVVLHDGQGTIADVSVSGAALTIREGADLSQNPWLNDVRNDVIAPELFDVYLVEGPSVGNRLHYIVFSTTDKQSGIDHYEVLETDPQSFGFLSWLPREAYWVRAESPYVLRDQKLRSRILVKAVDKAGNERVVAFEPELTVMDHVTHPAILIVVVFPVLAIAGGVVWILFRRRKLKKSVIHSSEHE